MALERLERVIEAHVRDAIIDTYNALEQCAACSGIKADDDHPGDYENANKARWNHFGHPGFKGVWVPERTYITNAVDGGGGEHHPMPSADVALRRVVMDVFRNSVVRQQHDEGTGQKGSRTSSGSNMAFGTTNSLKKVLLPIAEQMYANQMSALANVMPDNTDATLKRKKGRSSQPLVDYGDMRAATRFWVEIGDDEDA